MVIMLSCFKHRFADTIKQRNFNEIFSKMHILIGKRILKLSSNFLNDLDELDLTQHNDRRNNFESIHKNN